MKTSKQLKVAIEAAKAGAREALKYFNKDIKIKLKSDTTISIEADKKTEEVIISAIQKSYPNANFVGEEIGGTPDAENFWIIDPIDGTTFFVHEIPLWSILIAFCENKKPILGVSYLPLLDEIVYAEVGKGAYTNGRKINVSKVNNVKDAFMIHGVIRFFKDKQRDGLLRLVDNCRSGRGFGSAYEFHLLASDRCDIVIDAYAQMWDAAPFKVITDEAGGKMTNWKGKEWTINDRGCIATNGLLHDEVIRILNEV